MIAGHCASKQASKCMMHAAQPGFPAQLISFTIVSQDMSGLAEMMGL